MGKTYLFILFFFTTLILQVSCKKEELSIDGFNIYKIQKGQHYSNSFYQLFKKSELNFAAIFDNSAIYTCADSNNQGATNKLYGFSDGYFDHHSNSARFSWRWFENKLQIYMYCYRNKVRTSKHLTDIELNKVYVYKIRITPKYYVFSLNGVTDSLKRDWNYKQTRYLLYPYFGGKEKASHDITIKIKDL